MVMNEKWVKRIIVAVVLIAMLIPLVLEMLATKYALETIEYDDLTSVIARTQYYGFALVYVGPSSSEYTVDNVQTASDVLGNFVDPTYGSALAGYYLDSDAMSNIEKAAVYGTSTSSIVYLLIANGVVIDTLEGNVSEADLMKYVSTDSGGTFSEDLQYHKVVADANEYKKLIKDKKNTTMAVFGQDDSLLSRQYRVIFNKVARDRNVDIYYFNATTFDKDEYSKVLDLGLTIPAECRTDGEEALLKDGFEAPLTLFTKNNKVIGCLAGFTSESDLIKKLQEPEIDMIKTDNETDTDKETNK